MAETNPPTAEPRKRGRPRTITDDKEIPERRRKQLRVAQQAYRKRKETTINNLQTRVDELESGIEKLSQSFLSFSNLLLEESILEYHPRITSAFQEITHQCVSLAKQGCDESDDENAPAGILQGVSSQRTATEKIDVDLDFSTEFNGAAAVFQSESSTSTSSSPPTPAPSHWADLSLPLTPPDQEQAMYPFDSFLSGSSVPLSLQSPGLTVSPANLMNQRQWSLSHRIVRQCSHNGYKLLVYSPHDDARIKAVFGHLLTDAQLEWSIKGMYSAIVDEVGDTLDSRSKVLSPAYPMRDAFSLGMIDQVTRSGQLVAASVAGEWMDASGVQKLIQERGIDIQPDLSQSCGFRVNPAGSLDVGKFISILCSDVVCVGPGPAFRRKSVERALLRATQSTGTWAYTPLFPMPD
ncbi:bZIP transcription factor bZIP-1 [Penicillium angulare]|uniref:bZIP transcription factor bZIP-1 n=1 Tax=Penicillium angulare TaxID=116970 RepID=UPI00253FEF17|nr:bZIP transcription factor bZIP-1 [Penicillium angulare]KAJ5287331.1 bZIP transcription factor bZIP-1 [Penicillium angulare]